jgi:putative flippase GtrA
VNQAFATTSGTVVSREDVPLLDVVIPVYNEEADLGPCLTRLHAHLTATFPYPFRITVADNASTDGTLAVAQRMAQRLPQVQVRHLDRKGRGGALKTTWLESDAAVLAYMDVDLSTDLAALAPLVAALLSGHSDLAIGTRLSRGSRVVRGAKREFISRSYNLLLRGTLAARFSDAQCGLKAIRREAAQELLPLVEDTDWFFDTELLVLAERAGLRIHEVPVDWIDDPDSRVDIVSTAIADLKGIARLGRSLFTGRLPISVLRQRLGREALAKPGLARQLAGFAVVGVLSTIAFLGLFALLRNVTGAQAANLIALFVTAVANTAANRRLSFGVTGRDRLAQHHLQGMVVFGLCLAVNSGSLAILHTVTASPSTTAELTVLIGANIVTTLLRFTLLRAWVFRPATTTQPNP